MCIINLQDEGLCVTFAECRLKYYKLTMVECPIVEYTESGITFDNVTVNSIFDMYNSEELYNEIVESAEPQDSDI